jgi:hypothetical protein
LTYLCYLFKVGDPKQLPATVLSNIASKFRFECSMFERLQKAGHPVIMLTEQVLFFLLDIIQNCAFVKEVDKNPNTKPQKVYELIFLY